MTLNDFKMPDRSNKAIDNYIKQNVANRQKLKKKWDKKCKYESVPTDANGALEFNGNMTEFAQDGPSDNWVRLLDEGVVVDGVDDVYAVIKKGVLKKAYNAMPDDFEGNIDKDHNRSIELGTFTKKELRLVKLENDRYGIDVNVKLDDELYAVRDLKRIGRKKAISSEFWSTENEFVKKSVITGREEEWDYLVPLIDEVQITGYAVCDAPKNANSYDEGLLNKASAKEGLEMDPEELKKQQEAEAAAAAAADAEKAEEESAEADDAQAEGAEGSQNDASAEGADEGANEGAEDVEGEGEGDEGEKADEPTDADDDEALAKFEAAIKELRDQVAEKDAKIAELEAKLSAKSEQKNAFRAKLEKMLDFTTASEPEKQEGEAEMTPSEKQDAVIDEYKAAFAELNKEQ